MPGSQTHESGGSVVLSGDRLTLGYRKTTVVHAASVDLRAGAVTALVGPNGSGKSTLLRSLARLHKITDGSVTVNEATGVVSATSLSAKEFARRVTMLSQERPSPSGLAVRDVVEYGRHPHRRRFAGQTDEDRDAVAWAMQVTGVDGMSHRAVDELSGGELQRVWLATCLAQRTDVLLLDEPTNHLDLRYQVEVLDLIRELADDHDVAVGVVLHDLNQAAAVADRLHLLDRGEVRATGTPADVLGSELLSEVYGIRIDVVDDPDTGLIRAQPRGRHNTRGAATSSIEGKGNTP